LGAGLDLDHNENAYTIFREQVSGLEYIRSNREIHEKGLYFELEAYKCQVLLDFRQVYDNEWHQYAQLVEYLNGRGVPSVEEALKEIFLQPIHNAFRELVNAGFFRWIITNRAIKAGQSAEGVGQLDEMLEQAEDRTAHLLSEIKRITQGQGDVLAIAAEIKQTLAAATHLPILAKTHPLPNSRKFQAAIKYLHAGDLRRSPWTDGNASTWGTLLGWLFTQALGKAITEDGYAEISRSWIDEWLLNKLVASALVGLGLDERQAWHTVSLIKLLAAHHEWWQMPQKASLKKKPSTKDAAYQLLITLLGEAEAQAYLGVNRYQDVLWYNQEAFDELLWWLYITAAVDLTTATEQTAQLAAERLQACHDVIKQLQKAEKASDFQIEKLLEAVKGS